MSKQEAAKGRGKRRAKPVGDGADGEGSAPSSATFPAETVRRLVRASLALADAPGDEAAVVLVRSLCARLCP